MTADSSPINTSTAALAADPSPASAAKSKAKALPVPTRKLDEAAPGGRYLVGGVYVNAEGKPLADQTPDTADAE